MCEKISNKERLRLLLQPWIKTEELALILGCSKATASKRMAEIHNEGFFQKVYQYIANSIASAVSGQIVIMPTQPIET